MRYRIEYRKQADLVSIHLDIQIVPGPEIFNQDDQVTGTLAPFVRELQAIPGIRHLGVDRHHIWLRYGLAFDSHPIICAALAAIAHHLADDPLWEKAPPIVHEERDTSNDQIIWTGSIN